MQKILSAFVRVFSLSILFLGIAASSPLHAQAAGPWTTIASAPFPVQDEAVVSTNGLIYVVGGNSAISPDPVGIYNPATDSWTTAPSADRVLGAGGVINGKIFYAGGCPNVYDCGNSQTPLGTVLIFDPSTNAWTTGADGAALRARASGAIINNKLYITGGYRNNATVGQLDIYDPATDSWTTGAPMPDPRSGMSSAVVNGKWYLIGGADISNPSYATVDVYDPSTDTWATDTSLPAARSYGGAGVINGFIYSLSGNGGASDPVFVFNPATHVWTTDTGMNIPRGQYGAASDGTAMYAIGGANATGVVSAAEKYVPTPGVLVAKTHVINDNGGTKVASDFTMFIRDQITGVTQSFFAGSEDGVAFNEPPGQYEIEEVQPQLDSYGYTNTNTSDCFLLTVTAGATTTCTMINDDNAPSTPTITAPSQLPDATVGAAYSQAIQTTGGAQPFAWAITSGALPTGITLDPSSGILSGTPTTKQAKTFTVKVTDANAASSSATLTLAVLNPLKINTGSLPNGKIGAPYAKTVVASGGAAPYAWSVTGGAFPAGLALDPSTGIISGTPSVSGTFSVTLQVTDADSQATSSSYTLKITALNIATKAIPNSIVGAAYSKTLAATGGATPYTWSIIGGSLPAGLTLSPAGVISGTPTSAGVTAFTVQVSDANGQTDTADYTATTTQTSIATASLPNGKVGNAYSKTMAAKHGTAPYAWSVVGGALPAGLSLSADGVISGTPTAAGTASVTLQASDANGISDSQIFSLLIKP